MYKNKKILAIIPARGGSKGIKNKNIIDVCGKPLISYTLEAANNSKYIDYVFVSTDSEAIKQVSLKYNANVPFLRDSSLATDTSKTIDAIVFSLKQLEQIGLIFDYLVLLQPTSPLRRENEIDEAIEKIINLNYDSLASVCKLDDNPVLIRTIDNDVLVRILNQTSTVRRQDFKDYYVINGAIYINKISTIDLNTSFNDNELSYIMSKENSVDVDDYDDLEKVKKIIMNR